MDQLDSFARMGGAVSLSALFFRHVCEVFLVVQISLRTMDSLLWLLTDNTPPESSKETRNI